VTAASTNAGGAAKAAFVLCKAIVRNPERKKIKELIRDLQISAYADGRPGRGGFGHYASTLAGQFAGYLALDSRRARLSPTIDALPPITASERALLVQAHREVLALNEACVGDLGSLAPGVNRAVDPYGAVGADILQSSEVVTPTQFLLLSPTLAASVAEAFQCGSLCKGLRAVPSTIRAAYSAETLTTAVDQLDQLLRRPNIGKHSGELTAIAFQTSPSFLPRIALSYQAALVGLRSALRVLDQLVYQAFYVDRLPAVDSENLIEIDGPSTSVAERSVTVAIQPSAELARPRPGEVVYLVHPHLGVAFNSLGEIISTRHEMSQETGSITYLTLHLMDENLNPSPLFQSLSRDGT
jgi:hypothetical protein